MKNNSDFQTIQTAATTVGECIVGSHANITWHFIYIASWSGYISIQKNDQKILDINVQNPNNMKVGTRT